MKSVGLLYSSTKILQNQVSTPSFSLLLVVSACLSTNILPHILKLSFEHLVLHPNKRLRSQSFNKHAVTFSVEIWLILFYLCSRRHVSPPYLRPSRSAPVTVGATLEKEVSLSAVEPDG